MSATEQPGVVEALRAAWPQARAFLVALHLVAITLMALPAPGGGMQRSAWADPTVQAEFDVWYARLAGVGAPVGDRAEFEDRLFEFAQSFMKARGQVLEPFVPYYRYFGTYQSWRMFVAPHTHPARMHVEIRVDGEWQPVYVERSAEHQWLGWQLDQDRFRSAVFRYSWRPYRKVYRQFVDWLAVQALRDFPEATDLRVRFYKAKSPSPEQVKRGDIPKGRFEMAEVRKLRSP